MKLNQNKDMNCTCGKTEKCRIHEHSHDKSCGKNNNCGKEYKNGNYDRSKNGKDTYEERNKQSREYSQEDQTSGRNQASGRNYEEEETNKNGKRSQPTYKEEYTNNKKNVERNRK